MRTLLIMGGSIVCVIGAFLVIKELLGPGARWMYDRLDRWIKWRDVRDIYNTRRLR